MRRCVLPASPLCALAVGIAAAQPPAPAPVPAPARGDSDLPAAVPYVPDGRFGDLRGARARCKDGSLVYGKPAEETCAAHGGVARWLSPRGNQDLIAGR